MKIKGSVFRIIIRLMIVIVALVAAGTAAFLVLQIIGRSRLTGNNKVPDMSVMRGGTGSIAGMQSAAPDDLTRTPEPVEEDNWQEGDIRYEGTHYRYNEDIMTFLFLGIDHMGEVEEAENGVKGGQSDAVFLVVLNPHIKKVSIIGINRDTMTDIDVYSKSGFYISTIQAQLCLQHAYGDGMHGSCERTREAVSRLFYQLPIHGYCAVNMGAIPLINDAVGGVELEVLEDIPNTDGKLKEGQTVLLKGMQAYYYLHNRDTGSFNSAGRRLERQKQYLKAYAAAAIEAMQKDITLPVKLYSTLSRYMVTDISVDEATYLAGQVLGYQLEEENIHSLSGETRQGEIYEEFYADEKALYELILEVFYEEAED